MTKISAEDLMLSESTAGRFREGLSVLRPANEQPFRLSAVLGLEDLAAIRGSNFTTSISLEDGSAHYMGDDFWLVQQYDPTAQEHVSVGLSRIDIDRLLAAA